MKIEDEIKSGIISRIILALRSCGALVEDRSKGINNITYTFSNDYNPLDLIDNLKNSVKTIDEWASDYYKDILKIIPQHLLTEYIKEKECQNEPTAEI